MFTRKTIVALSFLLLISCYDLMAQRWQYMRHEMHFSMGASNFLGELGGADQIGTKGMRDLELSLTRPTFAIGHRYYFSNYFSLKTSFIYGRLNGDDQLTSEPYRSNRNLHFRSPLIELSTQAEYYFIRDKVSRNRGIRMNSGGWFSNFSSYAFIGVGCFYFNPKAKYEGKWVALQPLGTEGQGLEPGKKKYSRISVAVPLGIGLKYVLDKHWSIGLEYSVRKTFTDYVDDVSTDYYDNDALRASRGDMAADLADPNLGEIKPFEDGLYVYDPTGPGMQRGDPTDNDAYMFALISIQYRFLRGQRNTPKF